MSSTSKTGDSNDTALSSRERQRGTTYSTTQPHRLQHPFPIHPLWIIALVLHALVPDKIIDLIEQNAKALLSGPPTPNSTRKKMLAPPTAIEPVYMTETASYLTQTEGGGSISMHLRSHIKAHTKSPMGVIKYLDPRRAPHGRGGPESYTTTHAPRPRHYPLTVPRQPQEPHRPPPRHLLHLLACMLPILPRTPSLSRHHAPHPPTYRRAPRLAQQPIRLSRSLIGLDRAHAQEWIDYSQCPLCLNRPPHRQPI